MPFPPTNFSSPDEVAADPLVMEAVRRGFITIKPRRVTYSLASERQYEWTDPEEWVRCFSIAFLVLVKEYPTHRIKTEVSVPRRTPNDWADIVVYADDACRIPYLVVENKRSDVSASDRTQAIEQLFGNANSLRAPFGLYDDGGESIFFDVGNFPSTERIANERGDRDNLAAQYGAQPEFAHWVGRAGDITAEPRAVVERKIRYAHSRIWAGGKRDPLKAFDEWSKLLFAKVHDERWTPQDGPRRFQVGTDETSAAVANRVHRLFDRAKGEDPSIFDENVKIELPDRKIVEVVKALQKISFVDTTVDNIGAAFEDFFGSVFRGELGQYFTMRQIARFAVAVLEISPDDYVLDPTAGSGGFLLEVLLQVWHNIDNTYPAGRRERLRNDFALSHVFGIEIHDILARICKINLLLHHDGHTNIEGDRSCLDAVFTKARLNPPREQFTRIVGNPPFGDEVVQGDEDQLGSNTLESFSVAHGRDSIASEHAILERCVELLTPGGRLGLVLPDGVFNNQGETSNCPRMRRYLASSGVIEAIVSLPDHAFRRAGAQNKTSLLFFRKFTEQESARFRRAHSEQLEATGETDIAIRAGLNALGYSVFLAEATHIGYTTTGSPSNRNDLYKGSSGGRLDDAQPDTILGEYRRFRQNPGTYPGRTSPDCMAINAAEMWSAHPSRRLDPKYFLFKREERGVTPEGWHRSPLRDVMRRRETVVSPEDNPEERVQVMTISQTGEIRPREAGKGKNPPEWLGMYFAEGSSTWYAAREGDVVFSSIDLWKGCISVVPPEFDEALVTKEFPIYEVTDKRLDPGFLWCLLRSRYYQRAFRAITTGHSNRRRTQKEDFESLEIVFPEDPQIQRALVREIFNARQGQRDAGDHLRRAMMNFSDAIDGRFGEELPEPELAGSEEQD
ncbi:N-6 DNA methylase [Longimicrobium terrae]|uniref:Type I restriction enzyme M protein n=1 Tax=Longimicrobium terrae TaxID=1639882 RepID=A0A841H472_9BACT|nr:N-6 DNA methylase [Longimicrobium terrae]MBB4638610.1 type I restriction enzyme M protein [Longimicrobium terrae]MBB6072752.1 type I restriction enzyme M protein [Longimicrobium terrae]NNC30630.1 N-6 DNA methylase [Longimicrobium terrae]